MWVEPTRRHLRMGRFLCAMWKDGREIYTLLSMVCFIALTIDLQKSLPLSGIYGIDTVMSTVNGIVRPLLRSIGLNGGTNMAISIATTTFRRWCGNTTHGRK